LELRSVGAAVAIVTAEHLVTTGAAEGEATVTAAAVVSADLVEVIFARLDHGAATRGKTAGLTPGRRPPAALRLRGGVLPLLALPLALVAFGVGVGET
jgi:hypothetical protein